MVSQILWVDQPTQNSILISNSRCIKLWKLKKRQKCATDFTKRACKKGLGLVLPKNIRSNGEKEPVSKLCHTFKSGLESNLHSLSMSSDSQYFLSSDEKCINLWSLSRADHKTVFNLVDFNQTTGSANNYSDLISSATFNQFSESSIFLYTTSSGNINICDFRDRSDFSKSPSIQLKY